jgi:hypothetical protein
MPTVGSGPRELPAPPAPPAMIRFESARTPWPGFAAVTAKLPAPTPGVPRAVLVATVDQTERAELASLADVLDATLRARLRAAGPIDITGPGVSVVARQERVPDAIIGRATNADAIVRTKLRVVHDNEVRATLQVRPPRGGRATIVEARALLSQAPSVKALADSLAGPLARGAAAAIGGRDPRGATP